MPSNPNTLELENLSETGKAPKCRLSDPARAQELVSHLFEANRDRSQTNARIKGMLDGNRPYDQSKLKAIGQSNRTNVNWMEGKAKVEGAKVPYYDIFSSGKYYAVVKTGAKAPPDETVRWSNIITEEFHEMLKRFKAFDFRMQTMIHDMVSLGKGYLVWDTVDNWQFRWIKQGRVLVPDAEDAFVGDLEVLVIRETYKISKLYNYIRDEKRAKSLGWNLSAVKDAIRSAKAKQNGEKDESYEEIQQQLKDHDITEGLKNPTIQAAHVFVREFDGKVTHLIVPESGAGKAEQGNKKGADTQFLYKKVGRYENFHQVMAAFFLEVSDGSWNGANGIGRDLYPAIEAKNRLKCATVDNAFMRSSVHLQPTTADSQQKLNLSQNGPVTYHPPGLTVLESNILGDVDGTLKVDFMLDQMITANTGIVNARAQRTVGNPITAKQAEIDQTNQTVLGNSYVSRFLGSLDLFYAEVYRRASNPDITLYKGQEWADEALEFQNRCIERGVPREALTNVRCVQAWRPVGNGSSYLRTETTRAMMGIVPMVGETGRQRILEDFVAAHAGQQTVERYLPDIDVAKKPTDHHWQAQVENQGFREGGQAIFTDKQNHVIHAQSHLQFCVEALNSIPEGGDPADVLRAIESAGPNIAAHIQALSQDPTRKDIMAILQGQFTQLGAAADNLRMDIQKNAQKQREAMAERQRAQQVAAGQDPETMIKLARAKQDMALKDEHEKRKMANADAKTAQSLAIKASKAKADMEAKAEANKPKK
jgi:hypothetical protein